MKKYKIPTTAVPSAWIEQAQAIGKSVRLIQLSHTDENRRPPALRDVHPKHHGLVQGELIVESQSHFDDIMRETGQSFQKGVFSEAGRRYSCWLRFSSTSKIRQSDEVLDGRGVAIKLMEVDGSRTLLPEGGSAEPSRGQDFLLANGQAFFARDAAEMVLAASREAQDRFPSDFFLRRPMGLAATIRGLRAQADSPLGITYFSQTPYSLGNELAVKYRVRMIAGAALNDRPGKGVHYLREGLVRDLALSQQDPVVLELAVQAALDDELYPLDDATAVWDEMRSPFMRVATIELYPQRFVHESRAELAERIEFSPYHAIDAHRPLGSINFARGVAYGMSQKFRGPLNLAKKMEYTQAEWLSEFEKGKNSNLPEAPPPDLAKSSASGQAIELASQVVPAVGKFLLKWSEKSATLWLIPLALLGMMICRYFVPVGPMSVDLGKVLPSEQLIPPLVFAEAYRSAEAQARLNSDPEYVFHFGATGSEFDGGVPYWVFRALPRIAPDNFGGRLDWKVHGFDRNYESKYFEDYAELPRGLVLSDTQITVLGSRLAVKLKRVSFNCASCHTGEYQDESGTTHFVNGMPANVIDTVAFKTAVHRTVRDQRFTAPRLIEAINEVLAEEAVAHNGAGRPEQASKLTAVEELVYGQITQLLREASLARPIDWMSRRPENGPGRVDAFGALKFEYLGYSDEQDRLAAAQRMLQNTVVDLPSIWNQRASYRPWHHWDGNTADLRARNFGAIIGVGGRPYSIHQSEIKSVGAWIDDLPAARYPFALRQQAEIERGHALFETKCSGCHGKYQADAAGSTQLVEPHPRCMAQPVDNVGTDEGRARAIDQEFVTKLNAYGESVQIWGADSFRATGNYLCPPLDGIWARAPYLHNGSVPTLDDLLKPEAERPKQFYRGNTVYDQKNGGFSTDPPQGAARLHSFLYVTEEADPAMVGNSSKGHQFVIESEEERQTLIAYLLTL